MIRKNIVTRVVLLLSAALLMAGCSGKKADDKKTAGTDTFVPDESAEEEPQMVFPYELDGGNLIVHSLFQSSIENPDCGNEYAEDIASLEIENLSGRFLEAAEITIHMDDGSELTMSLEDIPTGRKVWAFDTENRSAAADAVCISMECETEYLDEAPLMEGQLAAEVNETTVTLTNMSEESLSGLTVGCHCLFDEVYYGGKTYSYPAEELAPGASTSVNAEDCFLGTAEVVRISKQEK